MAYTTLIDPEQLQRDCVPSGWVVFDCRFDLADKARGERDYLAGHIPGAINVAWGDFVDWNDPPEKATLSASFKLVRAALVVLVLAAVATRIPKKPERAEQKAPNTKESAISGLR